LASPYHPPFASPIAPAAAPMTIGDAKSSRRDFRGSSGGPRAFGGAKGSGSFAPFAVQRLLYAIRGANSPLAPLAVPIALLRHSRCQWPSIAAPIAQWRRRAVPLAAPISLLIRGGVANGNFLYSLREKALSSDSSAFPQ
jgi:hypothetical protein